MPRRLLHLRPWRRHSLVLAVASVVYLCYGAALITTDAPRARLSGLVVALELMSLTGWGIVWIVAGLFAFASTRWPPQSETWGYAVMSGLAGFWGACYFLGILFQLAPASGVTGGLVWSMLAFMWWAISGLMNPDDMHKPIVFDWSIYREDRHKRGITDG